MHYVNVMNAVGVSVVSHSAESEVLRSGSSKWVQFTVMTTDGRVEFTLYGIDASAVEAALEEAK